MHHLDNKIFPALRNLYSTQVRVEITVKMHRKTQRQKASRNAVVVEMILLILLTLIRALRRNQKKISRSQLLNHLPKLLQRRQLNGSVNS